MLHKDVLALLSPIALDGVDEGDREVEGAALDAAQARAQGLLREMLPHTSTEMLEDWERVLGLPDQCIGQLGTMQERRAAVVAKYTETGGQSRAYFIGVAAKLGYEVTITEYSARLMGDLHGDLYGDWDWNFVWQVNAPAVTINYKQHGLSCMGDKYRSWGNQLLECAIEKLKPAHTKVIFSYGD